MKRIMIITVAALLLLSLACQRTPKIPTVVPKDQEAMLGKADQQTTAAADTIPAHYTYDVTDESLLVHVDADVLAKRTDLPVVRVAAEGFSQETAKNMFDYWFAGEPAYQNPRYQEQTKSEIEPMLQKLALDKAATLRNHFRVGEDGALACAVKGGHSHFGLVENVCHSDF